MTESDVDMSISGIGYEGKTLEGLISLLRLRGVTTLVDVRLNAISRKRGFSKKALAAGLHEAGIDYVHLPALGNARDNRAGYSEVGSASAEESRSRYRSSLGESAASDALQEIAQIAQAGTVAVFCFEDDERHCHREQVLDELRALTSRDLVRA